MTEVKLSDTDDYLFLRFHGPFVDGGRIDLDKAAKTLLSLNRWFKQYERTVASKNHFVLRAGGIKSGSTTIQIFVDIQNALNATPADELLSTGFVLKMLGIDKFFQQFMGTLGEQLALKIFTRGKFVTEGKRFVKNNRPTVRLKNHGGKTKEVSLKEWELYKAHNHALDGFLNLEKGKEDRLNVGFKVKGRDEKSLMVLTTDDREAFMDSSEAWLLAERLKEPFDESKAKHCHIIGRFVDYYGLAHKYYFSFQARKHQDEVGKQKILCLVEKDKVSAIIEMLKPENAQNVRIDGLATADREGRIDKIKVQSISTDPDYDPNQTLLIEGILPSE